MGMYIPRYLPRYLAFHVCTWASKEEDYGATVVQVLILDDLGTGVRIAVG